MLRLGYFLLFSPPNQLEEMCTIKTRSLHDKDKTQLVQDELINFLSMRVLIARFEFSFRRALQRNEDPSKHIPTFSKIENDRDYSHSTR